MRPERFRTLQAVLDRRQPDLTVLMERVNKTRNLAAVLRSCDAVGVLDTHCVFSARELDPELDPHTSAGTYKWIDVHRHVSVADAVAVLKRQGLHLLAAHPSPQAVDFRDVDYTRPVAIMVGAELDGISEEGRALADQTIVIPMAGMVRSLNVSVATALVLFEAFRQRQRAGLYDQARIHGERRRRLLFRWAYPRIARRLDREGLPYPELDDEGNLAKGVPGSAGKPFSRVFPTENEGTPRDPGSRR